MNVCLLHSAVMIKVPIYGGLPKHKTTPKQAPNGVQNSNRRKKKYHIVLRGIKVS